MHDFLPENFTKVGGAYNLLTNFKPLFSAQFSPQREPISHADIAFHHLEFFAYSLI